MAAFASFILSLFAAVGHLLPPTSFPGPFPSQGKGPGNEVAITTYYHSYECVDFLNQT